MRTIVHPFGSKALQRHNQRHARAGQIVTLSPVCQSMLRSAANVEATSAVLRRRQADGAWWVMVGATEVCIGSGFDWKIAA